MRSLQEKARILVYCPGRNIQSEDVWVHRGMGKTQVIPSSGYRRNRTYREILDNLRRGTR